MTRATASPPSAPARLPTRWSQDRRLEFVDFRLRWDGRINRSDLTAFFGISVPQASLDIAKYLDLAPQNVAYDRSSKVYLATDRFKPLYPANEPARYLNELLARTTGVLQPELSFLGWTPPAAAVPSPNRALPVDTLVALLDAIRREAAVSIVYQSMAATEPGERTIAPHALAHDGFRWHVRAYCHSREAFVDFVIARILGIKVAGTPGTDGADDEAWHRLVRLVLAPNPELSEAHKRVIELDYGMTAGEVALDCRQALLFYALKRLGLLEVHPGQPQVQQIVLRNHDEVAHLLPRGTAPS
ncbi:MAG: WYL domain-containing protein [Rubrivivax sp.]|nr:WYL domain-containing protein [Rubrivivax sp.]